MAGNKQASAVQAATKQQTEQQTEQQNEIELNDDVVCEYLKGHHDFLQRHPDMLDYLHIAHPSGSAVSLVERQVSVLRERNMDMRHRLNKLTTSARANDQLFEQSSALVLKLMEADSTVAIYETFMNTMKNDFDVEHACMVLYADQDSDFNWRTETRDSTNAHIGSLLQGDKPVCGTLREEEFTFLFPGHTSGSAALVPLGGAALGGNTGSLGLIAVGSSDASRYHKNMGTLFLSHIADVVTRLIPHLSDPAS